MSEILERARKVFEIEATQIQKLADRIDDNFEKAVRAVMECKGKVVCTGVGKSGHVARKISATLSSTGTPSVFLHPTEGSHGDLGIISKGDVVVAISYSGESRELSDVLKYTARRDIPVISMTGNQESTLAKAAVSILNIHVDEEACPMGLAPTASSAATMAMGDALAMVLVQERGFQPQDFAEYHPGGSLGRRLLTRVEDLMHSGEQGLGTVTPDAKIKNVLSLMTSPEVSGIVSVLDENGNILGVVTDGDLRRNLDSYENILEMTAKDIMSTKPKLIDRFEMAERALFVMEQHHVQALIVVDEDSDSPKTPIGVVHLQDLLASGIR